MACNYLQKYIYFPALFLLFIFIGLTANAQLLDKKISMHLESGKLDHCLLQLQEISGLSFAYETAHLPQVPLAARAFRKKRIAEVLTYMLAGTGYRFEEKHNVIMIYASPAGTGLPQNSYKTCGLVTDKETGARLPGAAIRSAKNQDLLAVSDSLGAFYCTIAEDTLQAVISYLGYHTATVMLPAGRNACAPVRLSRVNQSMDAVIVNNPVAVVAAPDRILLSPKNYSFLPKFGGETDLISILKTNPGVQETFDGSGNLVIRGGAPDQNLILMDGATVYNSTHLLGLLSSVNAGAVDRLDVYKGAFPARYGGRISSIWDLSMKSGNYEKLHGEISLSTVASDVLIEGPLLKNRTSFMLSFRRSYHDLYRRISRPGFIFYFQDANFKLRHKLSEKDELTFTSYYSQDKLSFANTNEVQEDVRTTTTIIQRIDNHVNALKWKHIFSDQTTVFASAAMSGYKFMMGDHFIATLPDQEYESGMESTAGLRDLTFKAGVKTLAGKVHGLESGLYYTSYQFKPTLFLGTEIQDGVKVNYTANVSQITAREIGFYLEDHLKITPQLRADIGMHATAFNAMESVVRTGKKYYALQPRLNLHYAYTPQWSVNAAYVRMQQNIHRLTASYTSLPSDFWIPATGEIGPQYADQVSMGISGRLFQGKIGISVEPYYKRMHKVAELLLTGNLTEYGEISWGQSIVTGKGEAYGVELLIRKEVGRFNGRVSYTLASSTRTLPEVNYGKTFAYKYDRRHNLNLMSFYKVSSAVELSAMFSFQSRPQLPVLMIKTVDIPQYGPILDELNRRGASFLKAYHRLDVGVNFIKKRKTTTRSWSFSIFNVYNREQAFFYLGNTEESSSLSTNSNSLLPFSVVAGYRLSF
jgi:hypothetical protein